MDNFLRNKTVSNNENKEIAKHGVGHLKSGEEAGKLKNGLNSFERSPFDNNMNNSMREAGTPSFYNYSIQFSRKNYSSQKDSNSREIVETNNYVNHRVISDVRQDDAKEYVSPYNFAEINNAKIKSPSIKPEFNWGILTQGGAYYDQAKSASKSYGKVSKSNESASKSNENAIFETIIFVDKNRQENDEMVINPKSVFCPEEETLYDNTSIPRKENKAKVMPKEDKLQKIKKEGNVLNQTFSPIDLQVRMPKNKFPRYPMPNSGPIINERIKPHNNVYLPMIDYSRHPLSAVDYQNRHQYIHPPFVRGHTGISEHIGEPLYMNRPQYTAPHSSQYQNISPHCVTLLYSQSRNKVIINQDPQFFRIPQPTNNSLILQDVVRLYNPTSLPPNTKPQCKHRSPQVDRRNIIRLKINGQYLYEHDYICIKGSEAVPSPSLRNMSDKSFITQLNKFNEKYGIPKLLIKYASVMKFLYGEIRKQKGYYNVKPNEWKALAKKIKDFVKIKEIYLFLVYPFEQFLLGNTKVIRYKNEEILRKIQRGSKIYTAQDISLFLKEGSRENLEVLLNLIDVSKMTSEGFRLIITFFNDIFLLNLVKKEGAHKAAQSEKNPKNFYFYDIKKTPAHLEDKYISTISRCSSDRAVKYAKRCIEIAIEFGKRTHENYKILDVCQQFLNKVFFSVFSCKKMGIFSWEEFFNYTNNCFKNFYPGKDEIYLYLYKNIKTNPKLVLRTLSNIRFSKNKTKRVYRKLSKFISCSIEDFINQIENRKTIEDDKVVEYIVSSFYISKGFRGRIKSVLISILKYHVYLFEEKIFKKNKKSSDLFKIITRLMLFEDIRSEVHADEELIRAVRKIPGIRELV
ncbi:hypothetical protein NGRA_2038 [Nosema granulosis]|uniref:Uncharacterized protein n=1 Tax=Nosema granulosis TaxID=83296 RepID=A0A9P6KYJ1_9MICR|nr:hypothetical protein NGRA_2038 [Nosema granulosis]